MVDQIARDVPLPPVNGGRHDELADIELSLLLEAVRRWQGFDYREYAAAPLKRRINERMRAEGVSTISALQDRLLHDATAMSRFILALTMPGHRLFDPPDYWLRFRTRVVPLLRTYSFVRLWFPNCGTGDDVYSAATILHEEGLLDRAMIYATSESDAALEIAREGILPIGSSQDLLEAYRASGGDGSLTKFCEIEENRVRFADEIRRSTIFARHCLTSDGSLNEFHAIVTRGALPLFSKTLLFRVHNLLLQSLGRFGFLCLGPNESLRGTPHEGAFREIDERSSIYRRMR